MTISAKFYTYPLKSAQAIELSPEDIFLLERGMPYDREWMLVDNQTGQFLSQRNAKIGERKFLTGSRLAGLNIEVSDGGETLVVRTGQTGPISFSGKVDESKVIDVSVHGDQMQAVDMGEGAAQYFSYYLDYPCRLTRSAGGLLGEERPLEQTGEKARYDFADGAPLLITNRNSWEDIKSSASNVGETDVDRFRGNIVLEAEPFLEDKIKRIRIGDAEIELLWPCARCPIPNFDQKTGERKGKVTQALMTAGRRSQAEDARNSKNFFGWNAVVRKEGSLGNGQVEVLEYRSDLHPDLKGVTRTHPSLKLS
ncbi:MAG: MOSC domain-containing protein [Alphaproteobacteria bacterium]|nr:MOSC domain-containing protein [Alphaproteobacteria bacterium]